MFDGADVTIGGGVAATVVTEHEDEWREVDRELRRIARRRGELDAEELRWLARAERAEVHRQLGMASMLEYLERVLGYGPKTGRDRLRVARKLAGLPRMAAALDAGALAFSAVRELSRFVTPATEEEWLAATRGRSLREIEDMSRGRRPGARPGDPGDPDLELRPITLDLSPSTLGLFRDARRRLEDELGHPLTDDELMYVLCSTALDHAPRGAEGDAEEPDAEKPAPDGEAPSGDASDARASSNPRRTVSRRAPYQVALVVCEYCDRAWHDATGKSIEVPMSTVEQARCDAQYLGYVDGDAPARAFQEVPPAVARMVIRRDRGRCRVPGCRSSRWIHIHHIVPREHGGTNDPWNLVCVCSAHHQALHRAQIALTGRAPDALVFDLTRYDAPTAVTAALAGQSPRSGRRLQ